ncbi:major facilitator superfamily domain-containing protein [Cadophora sp. MPI-SDFR-AT-0126]|nr:major facilitator superfamily domain-containing protein [Leotiomycetes sp. MPI-SDFR-AT-0126]
MLIGGCANTLTVVIGGQVLTGVAVGCSLLASPTVQEIVPKKQRTIVMAFCTLISSGSFIAAPIIEGVFIQHGYGESLDGWRIGFYIGAAFWALCAIGLVLFFHPMPRPNPEGLTTVQQLRKFDWIGLFLASAAMSLFLVGMNYGDNPYPWSSPMVLGPLVPGTISIFLFILWEWKGTSTGLLPHALFEDRNFPLTMVIRIVGGIALFGGQAFLPQVAVFVFGTDGTRTAVWQLPFTVSAMLGAFLAGGLLRFFKEIKWLIFASIMLMALGGGLCVLVKPNIGFVTWFFPCAFMGIAVGGEAMLLTVISGLAVPNRYIATGVCIGTSAGFLGGALATTIYGQVYRSKLKIYLPAAISNAAITAGLPPSSLPSLLTGITTGDLASVPGATPIVLGAVQTASRNAYAKSFSYIWYVLIAWSALSAVLALLYGSTSAYMTNEVAAPVECRRRRTAATQREGK